MSNRHVKSVLLSCAAGLAAAAGVVACSAASAQTLNAVKDRGAVVCGVSHGLAGFGMPDASGAWSGLDVDYCRAVAAAVFNDPTKVQFVPISVEERFDVLKSGKIDVLAHNSTWTMSREANYGLTFVGVNYFDQVKMTWFALLAMVSAITASVMQTQKLKASSVDTELADPHLATAVADVNCEEPVMQTRGHNSTLNLGV